MARLPSPGGDPGNWGSILNGYLSVSHNSDGTLLSSALQQSGAVTSVNGKAPSSGVISLTASDVGALASGTTASGDLSGTYPSPTVAKLNGITVSGTPSSGQTLIASSNSAASWSAVTDTTD